jgi:hypothetical protein
MPLFRGWVNPLKFPELDLNMIEQGDPTAENILDFLSAPQLDGGVDAFCQRYREIAALNDPIPVAPAESTILEKLVWPLRHAKGSYALGSYLSCIALCGMVGEMVALLLWEISNVTLQNNPLDEAAERALLGSSFERLGQERRTQVLLSFGRINAETKVAFDSLREIRRRYLHFLSQAHEQLAADARTAYEQALSVVSVVLGVAFKEEGIALRPDLMAYLTRRGLVEENDSE